MTSTDSEYTEDATLLEVNGLSISLSADKKLFHDVTFRVRGGDVLVIQGKSGSGKSTLLKSLAHLNLYEGDILFRGKPPKHFGIPKYRTYVTYVPQRPSLLPGTPRDFLQRISEFNSYKARMKRKHSAFSSPTAALEDLFGRAIQIAEEWGIDNSQWDQPWLTLSGGEVQRMALATAVGMNCSEILLVDEPTSALDFETSVIVEKHLTNMLGKEDISTKAIVWVTHSPEQAMRVGTRFVTLIEGTAREDDEVMHMT